VAASEPTEFSTSAEDVVFMQRLDRLVIRLLAKRIRSPRGFWRFELDLLKLQRDIQAGVTRAKASGTRQGRHEAKQQTGNAVAREASRRQLGVDAIRPGSSER